jgi:hypothetical protein
MFHQSTKRFSLVALIVFLMSQLIWPIIVAAQPGGTPPGGNIDARFNTVSALNNGGVTAGEDKASGTANTPGYLKLWSAGDNAYYTSFTTGTQTGNAAFTLPTALPSGNAFLKVSSGGVMSWDLNNYLTSYTETDPLAVKKSDFTANGDILVGTGSGTYTTLPKGTANQVLKMDSSGTNVQWGTDATGQGASYDTIQDEGTGLTQRSTLNFIGSAVTAVDDSANNRTNVTITETDPTNRWTLNGSDIYSNNSGEVGIGVTAPTRKLEVNSAGGSTAIYGQYSVDILGWLASSSVGAYGQYSSTRYGYLGGANYGAYGQYNATQYGMLGLATAGVYGQYDMDNYGYLGTSNSGVQGVGTSYGVAGQTSSTTGTAVYGNATATSGVAYGVRGVSSSSSGFGGHFTNSSSGTGLYAASTSGLAADIAGDMHLAGALKDMNNQAGTSGQILSTTGTGVDWVDAPSITETDPVVAGKTGIITSNGTTITGRTLTAGSTKVSITNGNGVSGNPTVDVNEANLTLNNIGGTLGMSKGGTGLTAAGTAGNLLRSTGSAWESWTPNYLTSYTETDPLAVLKSVFTAAGDILVGTGSGTYAKLGIGTNGQVLKSNGTTVTWGTDATGITTETDPVVKAINGIVKSNGTTISAAVAGTDYVASEADTLDTVTARGATTTNDVTLDSDGGGTTTVGGGLGVKGAAGVTVGEDKASGTANTAGAIKVFSAGDNAYYTTFTAGTQTANATYTLPTAMPSATGFLKSTNAGVMSWDTTSYAPIASPTFTGDPKAPTPATADNDTSIATTAFVKAQGYLSAEADTLATVTGRGNSTTTGISVSTNGNSIYGATSGTTGGNYGVSGVASGATGATYGVYGSNASDTGYAGYFTNTNTTAGSTALYAAAANSGGVAANFATGKVVLGGTLNCNGASVLETDASGNIQCGADAGSTVPTLQEVTDQGATTTNTISAPTFQGNGGAVTFGNATYATTIAGSGLTISPTAWTATPTISGKVTMTGGFDSNAASTVTALTVDGTSGSGDLIINSGETAFTSPATTAVANTMNANSVTTGTGLAVNANALTSGTGFKVSSSSASGTGSVAMITNTGTATSFRVNDETGDADTTPFVIDASGNVGIGIATPSTKLHVVGGARITDLVSCDTIDTDANGVLSCGTDATGITTETDPVVAGKTGIITSNGTTITGRTLTAGSTKVSITNGNGVSGNPTVDVNEANLTLNNIGGTLGMSKGGTGLTAAGTAGNLLRSTGSAWESWTPNYLTSYTETDPLAVLKSVFTAAGDILVGTGSGTYAKLGIGTNGQVLKSNGTTVTWGTDATGITTETDPVVKAINGIVKSNGTTISAAVAGTDYVASEADTLDTVTARGATTTNDVTLDSDGGGTTTVGGGLGVKGAAGVTVGEDKASGTANTAGAIKVFSAGDNAYYTTFTAGTQTANATYTLPTAMPSATGFLKSTNAGVMSWDTTSYAPIASPTFTGDPKAPTPATADNDTSIATTAFVKAQGYLSAEADTLDTVTGAAIQRRRGFRSARTATLFMEPRVGTTGGNYGVSGVASGATGATYGGVWF